MKQLLKSASARSLFIAGLVVFAVAAMYPFAKADPIFFERNIPNPTCLDNVMDLPHSGTYNPNNPWNPSFMPMEQQLTSPEEWPNNPANNPEKRREQFIDLNGDGLLDYLYVFHEYSRNGAHQIHRRKNQECVYLNNGQGWDLAYRCKADVVIPFDPEQEITQDYYGDCALVE
jgi:hypothetical protein